MYQRSLEKSVVNLYRIWNSWYPTNSLIIFVFFPFYCEYKNFLLPFFHCWKLYFNKQVTFKKSIEINCMIYFLVYFKYLINWNSSCVIHIYNILFCIGPLLLFSLNWNVAKYWYYVWFHYPKITDFDLIFQFSDVPDRPPKCTCTFVKLKNCKYKFV